MKSKPMKAWFDARGIPWCSSKCPMYNEGAESEDMRCDHPDHDDRGDGDVCTPALLRLVTSNRKLHRRCQAAECAALAKLKANPSSGSLARSMLTWAATDNLRHRQDMHALLKEIMQPTCVVCECLMVGPMNPESDDPPHCEECYVGLEHEQQVLWSNETQPRLLERIKTALGED